MIRRSGLEVWLQVDGGVSTETIERAAEAWADVCVAGSRLPRRGTRGRRASARSRREGLHRARFVIMKADRPSRGASLLSSSSKRNGRGAEQLGPWHEDSVSRRGGEPSSASRSLVQPCEVRTTSATLGTPSPRERGAVVDAADRARCSALRGSSLSGGQCGHSGATRRRVYQCPPGGRRRGQAGQVLRASASESTAPGGSPRWRRSRPSGWPWPPPTTAAAGRREARGTFNRTRWAVIVVLSPVGARCGRPNRSLCACEQPSSRAARLAASRHPRPRPAGRGSWHILSNGAHDRVGAAS